MSELEMVLTWLGMPEYLDRFLRNGFDSWETLCEIREEDLSALDVGQAHQRRLYREIAKARQLNCSPTLVSPPYQSTSSREASDHTGSESHPLPPGKRAYRHHPKPDEKAPSRPYSAYVMFSNHIREEIKERSLPFTEISKFVGDRWQALAPAEKEQWKQRAAIPWDKYKQDVVAYQKTEDFRKYEQYVAEFKTAQAAKRSEGKSRVSPGFGTADGAMQQRSPESISERSFAPTLHSDALENRTTRQTASLATTYDNPGKIESKVPISRIKPQGGTSSTSTARAQRVTQACNSCRQRRIKCSGERPVCKPCQDYSIECEYQDGKRDKERRLTEQLWKKVKAYETLLLDLVPNLDSAQQSAFQRALLLPPSVENRQEMTVGKTKTTTKSSDNGHDGESIASGVGSMGSTDHVDYDDYSGSGPERKSPAYVGQASEVAWMQRLGRELNKEAINDPLRPSSIGEPLGRQDPLWPEDMDSSIIGDQLDPFGLPIKPTADALLNTYFKTIHPAFPILDEASFLRDYELHFSSMKNDPTQSSTSMALLQAVLALGAVHAHLTDSNHAGDDRDHLLYFARSRVLGTHTGLLSEQISLAQVQLLGLAAVYLIATNQTNRAWCALGVAIRCAQGLGLHLENVTKSIDKSEILHGIYVWYALLSTERVLSIMSGRPCMVKEHDCSAPIPLPVDHKGQSIELSKLEKFPTAPPKTPERRSAGSSSTRPSNKSWIDRIYETGNQSLSMTYFFHYLELNRLSQRVMEGLYNPHVRNLKWVEVNDISSSIQRKIELYDKQLTQWYSTLPIQFDPAYRDQYPQAEPLRAALDMLSYSTRTIINRPALCRTDRQVSHQSDESVRTSQAAANRCVHAAQAILQLLPGEPRGSNLNESPIWYTVLHHIKRSATVLLLELAFRAEHMPSKAEEILADATKAVNWIHAMGAVSPAARGAWVTLNEFLQLASKRVGGSTADLITTPPQTDGANRGDPFNLSMPPLRGAQPVNLDTWLPMTSYPGEGVITNNPLYGDMQMGGMDQFGFFTRPQQDQTFFPSASEMMDLAAQYQPQPQQQDQDREMWQPAADRGTYFGYDRGSYQ